MKSVIAVAVLLVSTVVLGGCGGDAGIIADPPEAFYPYQTVILHQSVEWGGLQIDVENVASAVGEDIRDIDLTVKVVYVNKGSEDLNPPTDVRFEYGFKPYPAAPLGELEMSDGRFVDGPVPAGSSAKGLISGTLVGVAHEDPPSGDEMRKIVSQSALVFGSVNNQVVVPFEEEPR